MRVLITIVLLSSCIYIKAQTLVEFFVSDIPEKTAEYVGIRGNKAPLSWQKSTPLEKVGEDYSVTVEFDKAISEVEFKFVLFDTDDKPTWEGNENRYVALKQGEKIITHNKWDTEQVLDVNALPKLQPQQLLSDYQLIETMVLDVHPGTYRYNNEKTIQEALAELKTTFQKPLTYGAAYLAMSKISAQIQCDHTKVGFNNQNKIINSIIHYQQDKLPFTFKWVDGKMIVIYDASEEEKLPRGIEILRINQVAVQEIQQTIMPYLAADGATDKSRIAKMEVEGFDFRYNAFDVFYPLLFPVKGEGIVLEAKSYEKDEIKTIIVKPLTRQERNQILINRYPEFPKTRDDLWDFEITENRIGVLTLNSFGLVGWKRMTIDYKQFLADAFERLKKEGVKHLIIDIRINNGGMDEMAEELLTYFDIGEQGKWESDREGRTRYIRFPESLKPYAQTWGDTPWYYDLNPDRIDQDSTYYIFEERYDKEKSNKKKKNKFKGDIYLLTSSANASLAYYVAKDFKKYGIGTIVGQQTGGNLRGINGGQILFLRLPNSGIEIDFPVMGGFTIKEQRNHGVLPDIEVETTVTDILNSIDPEKEAVKKVIKRIGTFKSPE